MSTRNNPLPRARADEVQQSGRAKGGYPGLGNMALDAMAQVFYTTLLSWNSTATRSTTFAPIPHNFEIADIFTILKTAPVCTAANKIRIGTATDDDLFFVTGNLDAFTSGSSVANGVGNAVVRRTTATNALGLATRGLAGMRLKVTLPPTAAVTTVDGDVFGVLVVVPKV